MVQSMGYRVGKVWGRQGMGKTRYREGRVKRDVSRGSWGFQKEREGV
jgi:hypothetical protein